MESTLRMKGHVRIVIGQEVVYDGPNLITTAGIGWNVSKMYAAGSPGADVSHIAIGTGTTAAVIADTALETEIARVAVSGAPVQTGSTLKYSATFPAGTGTGAITELGLMNAGSGGTLIARVVRGVMTKTATDPMLIEWTITIS